ncbi:MAG: amidophosphoribosyltransferase, partial [Chlamydiia bacterium]|nr:amidophosphoribosyltransferase [Chlamydiia bacterium]
RHLRYATSGLGTEREMQPFEEETPLGRLSIVYNGNLVNYHPIREELEAQGVSFDSTSDAEVLLKFFCASLGDAGSPFDCLRVALEKIYSRLEGAYSVIGMLEGLGLFAFRDPLGLRPLVMADLADGHAIASETYALSYIGAENIIDLRPGELLWIDAKGAVYRALLSHKEHKHCAFEYVYFTKGNGVLEGRDVYQVRAALGRHLARKAQERGIYADVVTAVPNTSHPAALAMAWELRIRIEEGFIRRDGAGRTFILPNQRQREKAVSSKLAPVASVFQGRDVLIVDDSIVRGTVSKRIIQMARDCGARKVYFAATFPPITHPCFYGIDMHSPQELLARGRQLEEIEKAIGADGVIYNSAEDLQAAIGIGDLCMACCNGRYPTPLEGVECLQNLRKEHQGIEAQQLAGVNS